MLNGFYEMQSLFSGKLCAHETHINEFWDRFNLRNMKIVIYWCMYFDCKILAVDMHEKKL